MLYWQSCVVPELRQDVASAELFSLLRVPASSLSRWLWRGAVLGMLGGSGAEMGTVGNEAVTALGRLNSPECDSCPEMCQEKARKE